MTRASFKDGLGGILKIIKGVLRLQLGLLGKKQEEKRKGKVKHEKEMAARGRKGKIMVVLRQEE